MAKMGNMVAVMERITALYAQYADGLLLDTECLECIQATCNAETQRIITELRQEVTGLEREVDEQDILLAVATAENVGDSYSLKMGEKVITIGSLFAEGNYELPPCLDPNKASIPPVTVGDECLGPSASAFDCPVHDPRNGGQHYLHPRQLDSGISKP